MANPLGHSPWVASSPGLTRGGQPTYEIAMAPWQEHLHPASSGVLDRATLLALQGQELVKLSTGAEQGQAGPEEPLRPV